MLSNLDRYKGDLAELIDLGDLIHSDLLVQSWGDVDFGENAELYNHLKETSDGAFDEHYQRWYTESCAVIRQLVPDRFSEFKSLYESDSKRKELSGINYKLQDWYRGLRSPTLGGGRKRFNDCGIAFKLFQVQYEILKSVEGRFESSLFDIKQLVQADLFDSELDISRELNKNGFYRSAGVVAGVVLEAHLLQVCANHNIRVSKKNPAVSDFNELLKSNEVIDVTQWRFIQYLGDLRNRCCHKKSDEPSSDDVKELIGGVEKISKTVY